MLSTTRRSVCGYLRHVALACLCGALTACAALGIAPEETGLTGSSYHTGTLTVLRVDDAWHPDTQMRDHYKVGSGISKKRGRFVPLRGKMDIAGLDGPDRVVTKDDLITITLNSAFIKFFRELGKRNASGEIAVVLSFSAGSTVQENLLVYSSRGQTLGSFLDLEDWPVAGPIQIDGDSLLVRVVIIELDQQENEHNRQTVRALAGIGTTINPGLGPIFSITRQIADFIISENSDDVIFDQKFSLQRVDSSLPVTRSPLLYGKYILLMQEDKLISSDVSMIVPLSTMPPQIDNMRYDMEFDRVAKVYNYFPNPYLDNDECNKNEDIDVQSTLRPTFGKSWYEGVGQIDYNSFYPQPEPKSGSQSEDVFRTISEQDRACVLNKLVNGKIAKDFRALKLGYREPVVGEINLFKSLDSALKNAYLEGIRHHGSSARNEVKEFQSHLADLFGDAIPKGRIPFNYYVTQYPEAHTLVAQYPLHTHLIFSIDRSLGGDGQKFHERFQTFVDFMNNELQSMRDNDRIGALATALDHTVRARRTQRALLRNVDRMKMETSESSEQFALRRICRLWQEGLRVSGGDGTPNWSLSDAPVYNEIFHITGQSFRSRDKVAEYLAQNGWIVDENGHACAPPN